VILPISLSARTKQPLIIAHRGSSSVAPENTLAAFAQAIADGADGIEFDVQLAKDGIPVVIHDANLRRTARRREAIKSLTSTELASIDVGSWFNRKYPRRAKPAYANEYIPTLDQVFSLVKQYRKKCVRVYVELKTAGNRDLNVDLAKSAVDSIQRFEFHHRATVISFSCQPWRR
jgi:glycerophosphoryl diester phosphodiesterase